MPQIKYYDLNFEDFKKAFEFGTNYYLEPTKVTTGRTTFEPRGLGAILDAFTIGKLTEIGVQKILSLKSKDKVLLLDFNIKNNYEVKNEPDVVSVIEKGNRRDPNVFLEIKFTSENDRWLSITEEQFNTIKRSAGNKPIFFIYATIISDYINNNPKTSDLTGMFVKKIENIENSSIFQNFADLNAKCGIDIILSAEDIEKYGFPFERGMYIYETNIFEEKNKKTVLNKNGLRKDISKSIPYNNFDSILEIELNNGTREKNKSISTFKVKGSFILHKKSKMTIIECLSNVAISNDIFGNFLLEQGKFYNFNLKLLGRDSVLKRNNFFISKKRAYELIEEAKIKNTEYYINEIIKII
jgi:hypothetical protein